MGGEQRGGDGLVGRLTRRALADWGRFRRRVVSEFITAPQRARVRVSAAVRLAAAEYPTVLVAPVRLLRTFWRRGAGSAAAARADTVLTARVYGWEEAAARLETPVTPDGPRHGVRSVGLLARPAASVSETSMPLPLTRPVTPRDVDLPEHLADRLVVYTAVFGEDRPLPPIHVRPRGVRFVCFTDRELDPHIDHEWETVRVGPVVDPARERSRHRILAHEVLASEAGDCEWSIYVDPDVLLVGNLHTLVTRWFLHDAVVMFRDPSAAGWWDLAERHVMAGDVASTTVADVFSLLEQREVSRTTGAYDTSLIWRRHGDPAVIEQMERWWEHALAFPGLDDVALAVGLAVPTAERPTSLPLALGDACDSWYSAAVPGSAPSAPADRSLRRTSDPGRRRTRVAFLRDPVANQEITTILRGEQLSRLIADRLGDVYDVVYTDDRDALDDHVVVVLKQALQRLRPDDIEALGRRNRAVVNCWDDHLPDRDRLRAADAQMVLAIGQLIDLRRRFPERPTFLVTHHVNLDFPSGDPPQDRLRTGYFGARYNTVLPPSLADMVDVVHTAVLTADDSHDWMQRLLDHNCHWAVRKRQYWDGWKPFMKGFVAARYGAPVIVAPDDDDARFYLGDDYPFYATGSTDADLELLLLRVDAAFGGPEWDLARGIMRQVAERSSDAQVCADFRRMVDHLAG